MKTNKKKLDAKKAREAKIIADINEIAVEAGVNVVLLGDPPECIDSIIGVTSTGSLAVVYDEQKFIKGLMKANKCKREEAEERYDFNTVRSLAYTGGMNCPLMVNTSMIPRR